MCEGRKVDRTKGGKKNKEIRLKDFFLSRMEPKSYNFVHGIVTYTVCLYFARVYLLFVDVWNEMGGEKTRIYDDSYTSS